VCVLFVCARVCSQHQDLGWLATVKSLWCIKPATVLHAPPPDTPTCHHNLHRPKTHNTHNAKTGTDFYDVYTGVGARRIRETFEVGAGVVCGVAVGVLCQQGSRQLGFFGLPGGGGSPHPRDIRVGGCVVDVLRLVCP
jgi:hypothetical protein